MVKIKEKARSIQGNGKGPREASIASNLRQKGPEVNGGGGVISFVQDKYDKHPAPVVADMRLIRALFDKPEIRETKDGKGIIGAEFDGRRVDADVERSYFLLGDIDNGIDKDSLIQRLNGFDYAVHTTWSHTPDKPRYRIALPLSRPVVGSEYSTIYRRLNDKLGGILDLSGAPPSHFSYLPSCPRNRARWFDSFGREGDPLDVDALLSEGGSRTAKIIKPNGDDRGGNGRVRIIHVDFTGVKSPRSAVKAVLAGVDKGERNTRMFKYACSLRSRNADRKEAEFLMFKFNEENCDPPLSRKEALSCLASAWKFPEGVRKGKGAGGSESAVEMIKAADVKIRPIDWAWKDYLAYGKMHIFSGRPGALKSTVAFDIAAILSCGGKWPDGSKAELCNVVIWSGEDTKDDIIVPRLMAAGADLSRIHFIGPVTDGKGERRPFDPSTDMEGLATAMRATYSRCLILDPIVSAVAGDSHKNSEVRRSLQPIVGLAEELNSIVVGITHFAKGSSGKDPLERVIGSTAFGALPRVLFGFVRQKKEEGGGGIMARVKSNIGLDGGGFHYNLEVMKLKQDKRIEATRIVWGDAIEGSAREIFKDVEDEPDTSSKQNKTGGATHFLREILKNGPKPVTHVEEEARGEGIGVYTLRRTRKKLGIVSIKAEGIAHAPWLWRLPDRGDNTE